MPRAWPTQADEAAGAGESDKRGFEVGAAEAEVGAERIGQGDELDEAAIWRHNSNAAIDQRGDAEVSFRFQRHGIKTGEARRAIEIAAAVGCHFPHFAGRRNINSPEMARIGFGDLDVRLVGRKPHAVRRVHGVCEFANQAAIGACVIEPAAIDLARAALAMVGEIKSATRSLGPRSAWPSQAA